MARRYDSDWDDDDMENSYDAENVGSEDDLSEYVSGESRLQYLYDLYLKYGMDSDYIITEKQEDLEEYDAETFAVVVRNLKREIGVLEDEEEYEDSYRNDEAEMGRFANMSDEEQDAFINALEDVEVTDADVVNMIKGMADKQNQQKKDKKKKSNNTQGTESDSKIEYADLDTQVLFIKQLAERRKGHERTTEEDYQFWNAYTEKRKALNGESTAEERKEVADMLKEYLEENWLLIVKLVNKHFYWSSIPAMDLYQIAYLIVAAVADNYDYTKSKFSTYITKVLYRELFKICKDQNTVDDVLISLFQEIQGSSDEKAITVINMVVDPKSLNGEEEVMKKAVKELLPQYLSSLTEMEEYVLRLRFGLTEDEKAWTLNQIADDIGFTKYGVINICDTALRKMNLEHRSKDLI